MIPKWFHDDLIIIRMTKRWPKDDFRKTKDKPNLTMKPKYLYSSIEQSLTILSSWQFVVQVLDLRGNSIPVLPDNLFSDVSLNKLKIESLLLIILLALQNIYIIVLTEYISARHYQSSEDFRSILQN